MMIPIYIKIFFASGFALNVLAHETDCFADGNSCFVHEGNESVDLMQHQARKLQQAKRSVAHSDLQVVEGQNVQQALTHMQEKMEEITQAAADREAELKAELEEANRARMEVLQELEHVEKELLLKEPVKSHNQHGQNKIAHQQQEAHDFFKMLNTDTNLELLDQTMLRHGEAVDIDCADEVFLRRVIVESFFIKDWYTCVAEEEFKWKHCNVSKEVAGSWYGKCHRYTEDLALRKQYKICTTAWAHGIALGPRLFRLLFHDTADFNNLQFANGTEAPAWMGALDGCLHTALLSTGIQDQKDSTGGIVDDPESEDYGEEEVAKGDPNHNRGLDNAEQWILAFEDETKLSRPDAEVLGAIVAMEAWHDAPEMGPMLYGRKPGPCKKPICTTEACWDKDTPFFKQPVAEPTGAGMFCPYTNTLEPLAVLLGLNLEELVALQGAHSVGGVIVCSGLGDVSNGPYCPHECGPPPPKWFEYGNLDGSAFDDTPGKLDNRYFQLLMDEEYEMLPSCEEAAKSYPILGKTGLTNAGNYSVFLDPALNLIKSAPVFVMEEMADYSETCKLGVSFAPEDACHVEDCFNNCMASDICQEAEKVDKFGDQHEYRTKWGICNECKAKCGSAHRTQLAESKKREYRTHCFDRCSKLEQCIIKDEHPTMSECMEDDGGCFDQRHACAAACADTEECKSNGTHMFGCMQSHCLPQKEHCEANATEACCKNVDVLTSKFDCMNNKCNGPKMECEEQCATTDVCHAAHGSNTTFADCMEGANGCTPTKDACHNECDATDACVDSEVATNFFDCMNEDCIGCKPQRDRCLAQCEDENACHNVSFETHSKKGCMEGPGGCWDQRDQCEDDLGLGNFNPFKCKVNCKETKRSCLKPCRAQRGSEKKECINACRAAEPACYDDCNSKEQQKNACRDGFEKCKLGCDDKVQQREKCMNCIDHCTPPFEACKTKCETLDALKLECSYCHKDNCIEPFKTCKEECQADVQNKVECNKCLDTCNEPWKECRDDCVQKDTERMHCFECKKSCQDPFQGCKAMCEHKNAAHETCIQCKKDCAEPFANCKIACQGHHQVHVDCYQCYDYCKENATEHAFSIDDGEGRQMLKAKWCKRLLPERECLDPNWIPGPDGGWGAGISYENECPEELRMVHPNVGQGRLTVVQNMERWAEFRGLNKRVMVLPSDWSYLGTEPTKALFKRFGNNNTEFHRVWTLAFHKIEVIGWDKSTLAQCRNVECQMADNGIWCPLNPAGVGSDPKATRRINWARSQANLTALTRPENLHFPVELCEPTISMTPGGTCNLIGGFGLKAKLQCNGWEGHCMTEAAAYAKERIDKMYERDGGKEPTCGRHSWEEHKASQDGSR